MMYFNPYEISLLDGSPSYEDSIHSIYELVRQYAVIYKYLLKNPQGMVRFGITPEMFTFEYYRWAWTCVLTRGYEDSYNHLIIPCWDMVNHGAGEMDMKIRYKDNVFSPEESSLFRFQGINLKRISNMEPMGTYIRGLPGI